ncbi:MAG TPA: zf-HC2 domain-containing protein, partial [Terriglobales bacterium]|nr:zf-HC2 domain-containing protein [Terriglobales bacterium]
MSGLFDNMRRELQVEAGSGLHPEAEVLNAYLEGVLAPQERESVVTHLARCASCREVVALAAPPLTQTPPPKSLKDPAVRLALWRWAVVATTAVVVIAAVVVNNDRRGS